MADTGAGVGAGAGALSFDGVTALSKSVPKPEGIRFGYGTCGFRANSDTLDSSFLRTGFLAALRAMHQDQVVGVMITASHNLGKDNGVKIVDPNGGMLHASWEAHCERLANAADDEVEAELRKIAAEVGLAALKPCTLYIAKDTRESSERLAAHVRNGAEALGATVKDFGLLTTPQLHYTVRMENLGLGNWASEEGYRSQVSAAFRRVTKGVKISKESRGKLIIDGANGVGAVKYPAVAALISDLLECEIRNTGEGGEAVAPLNLGVGAEHAQKSRTAPKGFSPTEDKNTRLASFDGDADRLVYHYFDDEGVWHLLDGDAIASMFGVFFSDQLAAAGLTVDPAKSGEPNFVKLGLVQTAYANGASTKYIKETLGLPVPVAKTGVKYVHHLAEEYDLGIYFEPNGHGTVLFKPALLARFEKLKIEAEGEAADALDRILAAAELINQAVGDAITDMLFVEAVLALKNWGVKDWDAMYGDLPSRQTKLPVTDRTVVVPNANETRLIEPAALQAAIDELVAATPSGRAFTRPSGTEDVVRVYAEAATVELADKLALDVAGAVFDHAGGIGDRPTSFLA